MLPRKKIGLGLWCYLSGEYVAFTIPSIFIRSFSYAHIKEALEFWDSILKSEFELRGSDISKYRKEWILVDIQQRNFNMFAGYPIVGSMTSANDSIPCHDFFLDIDRIRDNNKGTDGWGIMHELGHNLQRRPDIEPDDWTEVTNNIYVLYAMYEVLKIENWIHPRFKNGQNLGTQIRDYITQTRVCEDRYPTCDSSCEERKKQNYCTGNGGKTWTVFMQKSCAKTCNMCGVYKDNISEKTLKDYPNAYLAFFNELIHYFGWGAYKKYLRFVEDKIKNENFKRRKTDDLKIDDFYETFSLQVEYDLIPLFDFWRIKIGEEAKTTVHSKSLPYFLPDDEFTQLNHSKVKELMKKYSGLKRCLHVTC
jgi:hypothetical protein